MPDAKPLLARSATIAAIIAFSLTACSNDTTYVTAPPAYGAAGQCYYADDPEEAVALQQAGLCPVNWAPAPMPVAWRTQYSWYYDSPRYYDRYVPAPKRKTYITHVHVWQQAHPQAVKTAPKVASQPKPVSSFRSGTGRSGGDSGSSRVTTSNPRQGTSTGTARSASSFRSGSRR